MKLTSSAKFLAIILGLFTCTLSTSIQAQNWQSANGIPTVSDLNEVQFVTDQIVYAVGNSGAIIKSTDGGESWSDISYGESKDMLSLYFFTENTGFVGSPFSSGGGGSSEMLAKTTDGGENWEVYSSFSFNDFYDLEFLNEQNGWSPSVDGQILYTSDGGDSWSSTNAGSNDLKDIEFVNDTTFWVAGEYGSLYKSSDGGATWESAIQLDTISYGAFGFLNTTDDILDVEFLDENTGYLVGETYDSGSIGFLLKTTNGGDNWSVVSYDFEHIFYDIELTDNEIVMAGGNDGFLDDGGNAIYISDDEGSSWTIIRDGNGPLAWYDLDNFGDNWIAVGSSGASTIFTLENDTLNSTLLTGKNITDLTFYNENNGVFVTGERYEGSIFITEDGGESWEQNFTLEGRKDFESVSYADENNIWTVGSDHYTGDSRWLIYHSSDHGQNWTKIEPDFPLSDKLDYLEKVHFLDTETGFIKAEDRLIKTTDGGSNWTQLTEPENYTFQDFETFGFVDEQFGWMAGQEVIAVTTDGGSFWDIKYEQDSSSPEITNIQFLTKTLAYVTMERGDMMKTTDGGDNWEDLSTFSSFDLEDLYFLSADTGYVVGDGGRILTTIDGGENFETNYDITFKDLTTVEFIDSNNGWIAGEKGALISTSNGGGITTSNENEQLTDLPSAIELNQNYPNPFNPTTNISYNLAENETVSLEVFDMLGRKVATIVNSDRQSAGQHTVSFDASDLSSGVYLYRLEAGNISVSKKLTLIK